MSDITPTIRDIEQRVLRLEAELLELHSWRDQHTSVCQTLVEWIESLELDRLAANLASVRREGGKKFLRILARHDPQVLP